MPEPSRTGRLLSIDALRGFDMFWIVGGEDIAKALARWSGVSWQQTVHDQLEHVPWEGFRFYDLIFPLFLFLVGTVVPFSLGKLREQGAPRAVMVGRILRRTALLFFLGLLFNHIQRFDFENLRVAGVLQRIALCYGLASLVVLVCGVRCQALVIVTLLLGYWAVLAYVPAPGHTPGDYSKEGNLAGYVDRHYLPGRIYAAYYGYGDNEGLLSTFPAVATALLGVQAGYWLRSARRDWTKVVGLLLAGGVCLAVGWYWNQWFPVVKNIWTSSFVLVAGGWSLLLLGLFYAVVDLLGFRAWAFFFVVIGANAITIYMADHIVDFNTISTFFLEGWLNRAGDFQEVLEPTGAMAVKWLLLWFLYRNRVFLRV